jgi:hypothetical protein
VHFKQQQVGPTAACFVYYDCEYLSQQGVLALLATLLLFPEMVEKLRQEQQQVGGTSSCLLLLCFPLFSSMLFEQHQAGGTAACIYEQPQVGGTAASNTCTSEPARVLLRFKLEQASRLLVMGKPLVRRKHYCQPCYIFNRRVLGCLLLDCIFLLLLLL